MTTAAEHDSRAEVNAETALIYARKTVSTDNGPMYGAVYASLAQAYATLALADRTAAATAADHPELAAAR